MVVAGGADDVVFRVQERIGALDDVTAAVMLLWGEIAQRRGFPPRSDRGWRCRQAAERLRGRSCQSKWQAKRSRCFS